jgi:adenosylcobinamide-GDP ribazoletransferase
MLAILNDSRIGAHGALALCLSLLLRWQALAHLQGNVWLRLPAAYGLSRASMVLLAAWSRPAGEGLGAAFLRTLPRWAVWVVASQAIGLAALTGSPWAALALLVSMVGVVLLCRSWFHRRLGGTNGDCLGFQCIASEVVTLAVLTCV